VSKFLHTFADIVDDVISAQEKIPYSLQKNIG